jgi:hypothetical protein
MMRGRTRRAQEAVQHLSPQGTKLALNLFKNQDRLAAANSLAAELKEFNFP